MAVAVAKATAKAKANVVEMSQVTRLESRHSWLPIWGRLCKVYSTFSCNIAQATPQSMQHKMIALHTHTQRVKESEMEAQHGSKECICCRQERLKAKAKHSNTTTQFSTSSCLPCCRCCCSLYSSLLDSSPLLPGTLPSRLGLATAAVLRCAALGTHKCTLHLEFIDGR